MTCPATLVLSEVPGRAVVAVLNRIVDEGGVEVVGRDGRAVADDDEGAFGAGERHVEAAQLREEADVALVVAAYERDDDHFFFAALKAVDRADVQILQVRA